MLGEDSAVNLTFEGLELEKEAIRGQKLIKKGRWTPFQARQSHRKGRSPAPWSVPARFIDTMTFSKDDLIEQLADPDFYPLERVSVALEYS